MEPIQLLQATIFVVAVLKLWFETDCITYVKYRLPNDCLIINNYLKIHLKVMIITVLRLKNLALIENVLGL